MSHPFSLIPLVLVAMAAAACTDRSTSPTTDQAILAPGPGNGGVGAGGGDGGGPLNVKCERRPNRSKISVDGRNLPSGSYTARVMSGGNSRQSSGQRTIGDEVEFDFDSNQNDIAEGATPISADFIQVSATPDVQGEILNASGTVVRSLGVSCRIR